MLVFIGLPFAATAIRIVAIVYWAARCPLETLSAVCYERILSRFAQPYRLYGAEVLHTPYPPDSIGAAAGLISTVLDLAKYDAAIDRHAFIKQETQEKAWTPFISNSGKTLPYGFGWFTETYRGLKLVWHFGDWTNSFSALMLKVPERNISFYILANSDALSEPPFYKSTGVEGSPFACTFLRLFVFEQLQNETLLDPHWTLDTNGFSRELALLRRRSGNYEYTSEAIAHGAFFKWIEERRASAQH